jgi:hypothetical protein
VAAAFDLTGNDLLPAGYPQYAESGTVRSVPPVLLKAIGWVESGWRQFDRSGRPLVAPDFGYGIMQVTSGMAGAFGDVRGDLSPTTQSKIATAYAYNIAYGAKILVDKWNATPRIGNGDPTVLENWYYALWAYNGWGWVNNPNNPRFTRIGTPAQNPDTFPYQERVLYFVQHPPTDSAGRPLWRPQAVTLPAPATIGTTPRSFSPKSAHAQPPAALSAVYTTTSTLSTAPQGTTSATVKVENTGTLPWPSSGTLAISIGYHLLAAGADPYEPITPFSKGVIAYAQGVRPLPRDVEPGQSVSITFALKAPVTAGKYRVVWDMEQGSETWFTAQGVLPGVTTLNVLATALTVTAISPTPTPRPTLAEGETYVADTSFPDGSQVTSGQVFDKGWLLFNSGQTGWGNGWTAERVSGAKFGVTPVPIPATSRCRTLNLVIALHAPRKAGNYSAEWRLVDPSGTPVGDRFTVVVQVTGGTLGPTPTPEPTQPAGPPSTPKPTPTATPVG